jgi:signal transduction histidine kinase
MVRKLDASHTGLTSLVATRVLSYSALALCIVLTLTTLLNFPYAPAAFATIPAIVAYYTAFGLVANLLTAYLFFVQFLRFRVLSLAVLAATYLLISALLVPHALTFPGVFSATGLFHARPETAYSRINTSGLAPGIVAITIVACATSLWRARRGAVLQVSVVTYVYLLGALSNLWAPSRYRVGWYQARIVSISTSVIVLCALLYEVNRLYKKIDQQNRRLEQQNTQLERQNALQRDFVSTVGHEFRTALTGIRGFSELLKQEDYEPCEVREYASDMNHEAQRLTRLISDLPDLDRMQEGGTKLRQDLLNVNVIIEEIAHRMNLLSKYHSVRLELEPREQFLSGDRDKIIQMITNLVSNAIKYSPVGGEVLLRSRQEGAMMHLSVHDQCVGIPPEKVEEVFERYHRLESEHTRYIGGAGPGLPLVRQIVEMHGGKTWAESTPGQHLSRHAPNRANTSSNSGVPIHLFIC